MLAASLKGCGFAAVTSAALACEIATFRDEAVTPANMVSSCLQPVQ